MRSTNVFPHSSRYTIDLMGFRAPQLIILVSVISRRVSLDRTAQTRPQPGISTCGKGHFVDMIHFRLPVKSFYHVDFLTPRRLPTWYLVTGTCYLTCAPQRGLSVRSDSEHLGSVASLSASFGLGLPLNHGSGPICPSKSYQIKRWAHLPLPSSSAALTHLAFPAPSSSSFFRPIIMADLKKHVSPDPRAPNHEVTLGYSAPALHQVDHVGAPPQDDIANLLGAKSPGVARIEALSAHFTLWDRVALFVGVFIIAYSYSLDSTIRGTYQVLISHSFPLGRFADCRLSRTLFRDMSFIRR